MLSNKLLREHRRKRLTLWYMVKSLWRWMRMGLKKFLLQYG